MQENKLHEERLLALWKAKVSVLQEIWTCGEEMPQQKYASSKCH